MLGCDDAEGIAAAEGKAGLMHRIIIAAIERAAEVTDCIEVFDRLAVSIERLSVLINIDTGDDGGNTDVLADAPERSGLDLVHVLRILAVVIVMTGVAEFVVTIDGCLQCIRRNTDLFSQLFERIGTIGVTEIINDADRGFAFGEEALEALCGNRGVGIVGIIVVEDLNVPALGSVGVIGVDVLAAVKGRFILQHVAHIDELDVLVGEALALHVDIEERFLEHQTGVEVVHHLGMTEVLHLCTGRDGHDVSVTGLMILLLVKVGDIRAPAVNHGVVVLVVAGCKDDFLGIELNVLAVFVLADHADHLGAVLDKLYGRGAVINLEIGELLGLIVQDRGDIGTNVFRLRTDVGIHDRDFQSCEW